MTLLEWLGSFASQRYLGRKVKDAHGDVFLVQQVELKEGPDGVELWLSDRIGNLHDFGPSAKRTFALGCFDLPEAIEP